MPKDVSTILPPVSCFSWCGSSIVLQLSVTSLQLPRCKTKDCIAQLDTATLQHPPDLESLRRQWHERQTAVSAGLHQNSTVGSL